MERVCSVGDDVSCVIYHQDKGATRDNTCCLKTTMMEIPEPDRDLSQEEINQFVQALKERNYPVAVGESKYLCKHNYINLYPGR